MPATGKRKHGEDDSSVEWRTLVPCLAFSCHDPVRSRVKAMAKHVLEELRLERQAHGLLFYAFSGAVQGGVRGITEHRALCRHVDTVAYYQGWTEGEAMNAEVAAAMCSDEAWRGGRRIKLALSDRALFQQLISLIPEEVELQAQGFDSVAYVLQVHGGFLWGVVPAAAHFAALPAVWSARNEQHVSRAFWKLDELLSWCAPLRRALEADGARVAVDIGASPGGWTEFLSDRGCTTIGIDPGALDETWTWRVWLGGS